MGELGPVINSMFIVVHNPEVSAVQAMVQLPPSVYLSLGPGTVALGAATASPKGSTNNAAVNSIVK